MRALVFALCMAAAPVMAQDAETLADIRQDLTVLNVEIQKLRRELSTTGGAAVPSGGTLLDRVTLIEGELSRLTARTEELDFRINKIVQDGTNRIGDLEFRLVELEGGDVSQLGETSTLGGETETAVNVPATQPSQPAAQMAVGEAADFKAAEEALAAGDAAKAAELFTTFNQTYPGGPFMVDAEMGRGDALNAVGDTREASRAYLAAYNAAPEGPRAGEALLKLGQGLGALGQTEAACQILSQAEASFPDGDTALEAASAARNLGCS